MQLCDEMMCVDLSWCVCVDAINCSTEDRRGRVGRGGRVGLPECLLQAPSLQTGLSQSTSVLHGAMALLQESRASLMYTYMYMYVYISLASTWHWPKRVLHIG